MSCTAEENASGVYGRKRSSVSFKSYTVLAITFMLCIAVMTFTQSPAFVQAQEMMTYLVASGGDFYMHVT